MDVWFGIFGCLFVIILIGITCEYIAACREAALINSKFKTNYRGGDLFWAGDVIKSTLVGKRKRIKLEE